MFAWRTPHLSRRCEPAVSALYTAGRLLGWATLVVAALMLLMFVTVETSQACPARNNEAPVATRNTTQAFAKQQVTANQSVASPSVIMFAIKDTTCCGKSSGYCHGLAGSCCPACFAGLSAAAWTVGLSSIVRIDGLLAHKPLSSSNLDTQFRPPREVL
jgi:hypothetical protein